MIIGPVIHGGSRHNRYCGPAVLSIVAGIPTDYAAGVIRSVTGQRQVTGTSDLDLSRALFRLGFYLQPLDHFQEPKDRPTLATWLRDRKALRTAGRVFVLAAGSHWQVISGRRYACGLTGEVVSVKDPQVKRRARVRRAFEVVRLPERA